MGLKREVFPGEDMWFMWMYAVRGVFWAYVVLIKEYIDVCQKT